MQHTLQFDIAAGELARDKGQAKAAVTRAELLELARDVARQIAMSRSERTVTADDVLKRLSDMGYEPGELGNAAGSIFKGGQWAFVDRVKSERVSNHARWIMVWRLQ